MARPRKKSKVSTSPLDFNLPDLSEVKVKIRKFLKKIQKGTKIKQLPPEYLRWFLVFFLALVSFGIIWFANYDLNRESADLSRLEGPSSLQEAWIEFDFGGGKKRRFTGNFETAIPLSMVLDANRKEAGISLAFKSGRIDKIDGRSGKWIIYHNNRRVGSPFVKLTIKGGDIYLFKLER